MRNMIRYVLSMPRTVLFIRDKYSVKWESKANALIKRKCDIPIKRDYYLAVI